MFGWRRLKQVGGLIGIKASSKLPLLERVFHFQEKELKRKLAKELDDAVLFGDAGKIKLLVQQGADVNCRYYESPDSLLLSAAKSGKKEIVELLLSLGATIDVKSSHDTIAPFVVAKHESKEIAEILVRKIEGTCPYLYEHPKKCMPAALNLLLYFAYVKNEEKVDALLQKGVKFPPVFRWYAGNLLLEAAALNDFHMARILVKLRCYIENRDEDGNTPLILASSKGDPRLVALLLKAGAKPNKRGEWKKTALMEAALGGDVETLSLLIEANAKLEKKDDSGETALHKAAFFGHPEAVDFLIKKGANPKVQDDYGNTPLMMASENENKEAADVLLAYLEKDCPEVYDNPRKHIEEAKQVMFYAVAFEDVQRMERLISAGFELSTRLTRSGITPLMLAVDMRKVGSLAFLLEKGADPDLGGNLETPLQQAIRMEETSKIIEMLLAAGANIHVKDGWGRTLLMVATEYNKMDLVKIFVERGVDINSQDNQGRTALMIALIYGGYDNFGLIKFLLDNGADPRIRDKKGRDAVDLAKELGDSGIATLLEEYSRKLDLKT